MSQIELPLQIAASKEVDGIEMGVLSDGTPYLSARGLARMAGIAPSTLIAAAAAWANGDRSSKIARFLERNGITGDRLNLVINVEGTVTHAYREDVVIGVLEYYAFETEERFRTAEALRAYRLLARAGMRTFIYRMVGYAPAEVPDSWQKYHDRMLLNPVPAGYFSIFKESAEFIVGAIHAGLRVDEHTVPDVSIGSYWAKHWNEQQLEQEFGDRVRHEHKYPEYFPQSAAQTTAWLYPVEALGIFRKWLHEEYVPAKFPRYLSGQVRKGAIAEDKAKALAASAVPPTLPPKKTGSDDS